MYTIGNDWARGMGYALKGIKEFWTHPRLWVYALLPFLCVTVVGRLLLYCLLNVMLNPLLLSMRQFFESWGWENVGTVLGWIVKIGGWLLILSVMACITSTLFEMFGGVFFSYMVRRYEKMAYGREPDESVTFGKDCLNMLSCVVYSLCTLLLYVPLFLLGFVFPVIAQIVMAVFIGYRYGISYCSEAGFNRGWSLTALQHRYTGHRMMLYGFGVAAFVLLMIPYVSILVIPGLVIGGTCLVDEEAPAMWSEIRKEY